MATLNGLKQDFQKYLYFRYQFHTDVMIIQYDKQIYTDQKIFYDLNDDKCDTNNLDFIINVVYNKRKCQNIIMIVDYQEL